VRTQVSGTPSSAMTFGHRVAPAKRTQCMC
jgi:hypothetical protein